MRTTKRTSDLVKQLRKAGMSVREIADSLGLSTQAVYYHLHKPPAKAKGGAGAVAKPKRRRPGRKGAA